MKIIINFFKKERNKYIFLIYPVLLSIAMIINPKTRDTYLLIQFIIIYLVGSIVSVNFIRILNIKLTSKSKTYKIAISIIFIILMTLIDNNLGKYFFWLGLGVVIPITYCVEEDIE